MKEREEKDSSNWVTFKISASKTVLFIALPMAFKIISETFFSWDQKKKNKAFQTIYGPIIKSTDENNNSCIIKIRSIKEIKSKWWLWVQHLAIEKTIKDNSASACNPNQYAKWKQKWCFWLLNIAMDWIKNKCASVCIAWS